MQNFKNILQSLMIKYPSNQALEDSIKNISKISIWVCIIFFVLFVITLAMSTEPDKDGTAEVTNTTFALISIVCFVVTLISGGFFVHQRTKISTLQHESVNLTTEFEKQTYLDNTEVSDYILDSNDIFSYNSKYKIYYVKPKDSHELMIEINIRTGEIKAKTIAGSVLLLEYDVLFKEIEKDPSIQSVQINIDTKSSENKELNIPTISYFQDGKIHRIVYEKEEVIIKVE